MACGTPLGPVVGGRELRKTVTALFCDLVGSTTLGEQHDPEVLRPILDGYFTEMSSSVERHGGGVQKFIGDAVVAVFGLPSAHEDDALRAVRAGVEMQERLQALNEASPIPLAARIGITTGEVLVPGDGKPVIGDAMNTASRLQSGAPPGSVLIGEPTWRLVRDLISAEPLEPLRAKGKAEPVAAWRVVAVRPSTARLETPLVGRDRDLMVLELAFQDVVGARASELVTILAPPGVGKSRLAAAFAASVLDRATVLVGQTPSYGEGVTFSPLVELLAQAAGYPSGEADEVAAALRARLAGEPDGESVGDRLAQFLGVGEASGGDTAWAVRRLFEVLASRRPLVVILEDAHWAEPPMLDLADAVIERVRGPVLFLVLARPELLEQRPTWAGGKARAVTSTLPALSPADTRRVAEILLGDQAPASVVDRVCETAEGNPLYLEQLSAMLTDQGFLTEGRWTGSSEVEVEVPATLHALLDARLDRLDPTPRSLLERASVEGRRFRLAAVQALSREASGADIAQAIDVLERGGLVQSEDEATGRWRFAHALVLDAAYRGLSKAHRAELHERLADWVASEDADQAEVSESVARHLERALHLREELGLRDEHSAAMATRAGELFAAAGLRAFAGLDLITSRDLLGRAAVLLPDAHPRRLDMLPNLGVALTETGHAEETEVLLSEAIGLGRAAGSERDALRATIQLLSNRIYRSSTDAEIDVAVEEAEAAAGALEALGDDAGLAEAAIALEYLEFMRGSIAASHAWTLQALRHALVAGRPREAVQAAADVVGTALFGPLPFDRFRAVAEGLFPLDEPASGCAGHALLALAALASGDTGGFDEHERRRRELADRNGLTWLGATHGLQIATVETWIGRPDSGERRLREAREVLAALGDIWWVATLDSSLCAAVAAQDRPQEFLRLADAFEAAALVADRQLLIRRSLIRSRALLVRGAEVDAEAAARRGMELATTTDLVLDHADAAFTLAEALEARGLEEEASNARGVARERRRAKGVAAAEARDPF